MTINRTPRVILFGSLVVLLISIPSYATFSVKLGYEIASVQQYFIDAIQTYENGVWKSYKIKQQQTLIQNQNVLLNMAYLHPLSARFFLGVELGMGYNTNPTRRTYTIPVYSQTMTGEIASPSESFTFLDENSRREISIKTETYFLFPKFVFQSIWPLTGPLAMSVEFGVGPRVIINQKFRTDIRIYEKSKSPYEIGDEISQKTTATEFVFIPECSGGIGIEYGLGKNSIGIQLSVSYSADNFLGSETTDLFQMDEWPQKVKLASLKEGYEYRGLRYSANFKVSFH